MNLSDLFELMFSNSDTRACLISVCEDFRDLMLSACKYDVIHIKLKTNRGTLSERKVQLPRLCDSQSVRLHQLQMLLLQPGGCVRTFHQTGEARVGFWLSKFHGPVILSI
jgi:hypothetical protein